MRAALARHDAPIEQTVAQHGGVVVRPRGEGDSRFAVFARATAAVAAAAAVQRALHAEPCPAETPLRVRLALHTSEADLRQGDSSESVSNRGYAAAGRSSVMARAAKVTAGFHERNLAPRPPLSARVRVCRRRWVPSGVHRRCCVF
jgi:class 3 adenylate cyclase